MNFNANHEVCVKSHLSVEICFKSDVLNFLMKFFFKVTKSLVFDNL